jgi:hypothetical protein
MLLVVLAMFLWAPILLAEESTALIKEEGQQEVKEKITMTPEELTNYPFEIEVDPFSVKDLTQGQIQILNAQRRVAKDLFARKLGILSIRGNKQDLRLFQQLVSRRILRDDQIEEWQAIGVLFGDVLANEFNMTWVRFEDVRGVNKALRWRKTDNFFFPVTMLSKRVRFGEQIDFEQIYSKLEAEVDGFKKYDLKLQMPQ